MASAVDPTDLLGTWHLERRIVDRDVAGGARRFGHVTGTLTLALASAAADEVAWAEAGTMRWAGQELAVFRNLRVVREPSGWSVRFEDGRTFHPWSPGTTVVHPCAADTYCGLVDVDRGGRRLRVLWDVTGPAKDRRIYTRCSRPPR